MRQEDYHGPGLHDEMWISLGYKGRATFEQERREKSESKGRNQQGFPTDQDLMNVTSVAPWAPNRLRGRLGWKAAPAGW